MKIAHSFFLILIPFILHSQESSFDGINKLDSLGKKQGFWIERTLKIKLTYFEISTSKKYLDEVTELKYFKSSEGKYLNDQKVGQWQFYSKCFNFLETSTKLIKLSSLLSNSKDTSIITGEIYLDMDTLTITCDRNNCTVRSSAEKIVKSFKKESLNTELENFTSCKYNRLIKRKMKNH